MSRDARFFANGKRMSWNLDRALQSLQSSPRDKKESERGKFLSIELETANRAR